MAESGSGTEGILDRAVRLEEGRLVVALAGWMDGGDVSTGTVEWLAQSLDTQPCGLLDGEEFYLYHFPGSVEISTLFRPHVRIAGGLVESLAGPPNEFHLAREQRLVLFSGHEPHMLWGTFADRLFDFCAAVGITEVYSVGSFGGHVPHTREPRVYAAVSHENLKATLTPVGVRFSDYEGPAGFSSYMLQAAARRNVPMISLVAEIPPYIQGTNPKCIDVMVRRMAALLGLTIPTGELRRLSTTWEERVNQALEEKPDVLEFVHKLEEDYDNEVFDTQMGDLKEWLTGKGIRLD